MAKPATKGRDSESIAKAPAAGKPSSLLDTRVVYCGLRRAQSSRDNLEQLAKLPDKCVDLIYIDPPCNSNRNYEVFWARRRKTDPSKTDTPAPGIHRVHAARCVEMARVLKNSGSFYFHCDWHASQMAGMRVGSLSWKT